MLPNLTRLNMSVGWDTVSVDINLGVTCPNLRELRYVSISGYGTIEETARREGLILSVLKTAPGSLTRLVLGVPCQNQEILQLPNLQHLHLGPIHGKLATLIISDSKLFSLFYSLYLQVDDVEEVWECWVRAGRTRNRVWDLKIAFLTGRVDAAAGDTVVSVFPHLTMLSVGFRGEGGYDAFKMAVLSKLPNLKVKRLYA